MKKLFMVGLLAFSISFAKSQHIAYDLPANVTKKFSDYISKNRLDGNSEYVIKLSAINDGKYLASIFEQKKDTADIIYKTLILNTARFIKIDTDLLVPMITSEDLAFTDFGTVIYPNEKGKRKVGKKKVFMTIDSYTITKSR